MNSTSINSAITKMIVPLGNRSYPIQIGQGLLSMASLIEPHLQSDTIMVVSHPRIAERYYPQLLSGLTEYKVDLFTVPEGETSKSIHSVEEIVSALLKKGHRRDTTLIALGGGVIGDLTGFTASCYQRGVRFIQCPTTLLAQVDASIGGKTAVNHPLGKNMIGSFYQPVATIIDTATLESLSNREFRSGLAEVVKAALIRDADFLTWLESNTVAILQRDPAVLQDMIARSCAIKAAIVAEDETEQGVRSLLNLGHTFAHAIECVLNYQHLSHGEAVAVGCHWALAYSVLRNGLPVDHLHRVDSLLESLGFDLTMPKNCDPQKLVDVMMRDKKNKDHTCRLVLLRDLGQAEVVNGISSVEMLQFLRRYTRCQ